MKKFLMMLSAILTIFILASCGANKKDEKIEEIDKQLSETSEKLDETNQQLNETNQELDEAKKQEMLVSSEVDLYQKALELKASKNYKDNVF